MSYDLKNLPIISSGLTDSSIVFGAKDGQSDDDPDPINLSALWDYVLDKMESAQADAQTALGITELVKSAAESAATASEAAEVASGAMTALLNPIFSTVATAEAYSPDAAPDYIRTAFYDGDFVIGSGATYRKVDTEPSHAGKFSITLSDGNTVVWYEIAETIVTPQMFGAKGDSDATGTDGTNDTAAFQGMASYINARGGGHVVIPRGETGYYKVFQQTINPSPSSDQPYYQSAGDVMGFEDCSGLRISFQNAVLVAENGLHYGSFDPLTGEAYDPGDGTFTDAAYRASIGRMIFLKNCRHYLVENANLNGNNENFVHGGKWGNAGRQVAADGIYVEGGELGEIVNFDTHHHGRDGIYVTYPNENLPLRLTLRNGKTTYNGRQGMSWTGGSHVSAYNVEFSKTSYGGVSSAPNAGLDIEHNGQGVSDGYFENCHFVDNVGVSVLNPHIGGNARLVFSRCTIQNGDGRRALWFRQAGEFNDCFVDGNVTNIGDTNVFNRTRFSNENYDGQALDINSTAVFNDCTIRTFRTDGLNFNIRGGAKLYRPKFIFSQVDVPARTQLGLLGGCDLVDAEFIDALTFTGPTITDMPGEHAHIGRDSSTTRLLGRCSIIGDHLAWASRSGRRNSVLNAIRQVVFTSEEEHTLSGEGPTFDINIGTGDNFVVLYKDSGNADLRRVSAIFVQSSLGSSAENRHAIEKLVSKEDYLGEGGSIATAIDGDDDVIRITEGEVPLDGETFKVRKIALSGTSSAIE